MMKHLHVCLYRNGTPPYIGHTCVRKVLSLLKWTLEYSVHTTIVSSWQPLAYLRYCCTTYIVGDLEKCTLYIMCNPDLLIVEGCILRDIYHNGKQYC